MPRFYFDVSYDNTELADRDGLEFDPRKLEQAAMEAAAEMVRDVIGERIARQVTVQVLDDMGRPVLVAEAEVKVSQPTSSSGP